MKAWKALMKKSPEMRKESEDFLRGGGGEENKHMNVINEESDDDIVDYEPGAEESNTIDECNQDVVEEISCNKIKSKDNAMRVEVSVGKKKINALIDTGATSSFIQEPLIREMGLNTQIKKTGKKVKLADGNIQPLTGIIDVDIGIKTKQGDNKYQTELIILQGKGPPLILGFPFFKKNGWILDCQNKEIKDNRGDIIYCNKANTLDKKEDKEKMIRLESHEEIRLKPGEKKTIKTSMNVNLEKDRLMYLQLRDSVIEDLGIINLKDKVRPGYDGKVHTVLWNPTEKNIRIKANTYFMNAYISPLMNINYFNDKSKNWIGPQVQGET